MTDVLRDVAWPAIRGGLALLPVRMNTREARVMLLAIGLQESRFVHRAQIVDGGGRGPARGFWQFEQGGGAAGVLRHAASREWILKACAVAGVEPTPAALWAALERDDILAACAARLLLYTDAKPLPAIGEWGAAWGYYLRVWRPGKPHPETWPELYRRAVDAEARLAAQDAPATVSPSPAPVAALPSAEPSAGAATTSEREPVSDFDWKATVRAIAPTLAGAFGGPLAGLATKVLGDALLGDGNASEDALAQAVAGLKPEDYVRLKDAERAYLVKLRELEVDIYRADQADRASARGFWQALVPSERGLLFGLAFAVLGLFGYAVWWTLNPTSQLPTDAARLTLIGAVIGYASAKADQVISFYFGSSSGSAKKTEQLGEALSSLAKR